MPDDYLQTPVPAAPPKEDVDDLIFCAEPEWAASQR